MLDVRRGAAMKPDHCEQLRRALACTIPHTTTSPSACLCGRLAGNRQLPMVPSQRRRALRPVAGRRARCMPIARHDAPPIARRRPRRPLACPASSGRTSEPSLLSSLRTAMERAHIASDSNRGPSTNIAVSSLPLGRPPMRRWRSSRRPRQRPSGPCPAEGGRSRPSRAGAHGACRSRCTTRLRPIARRRPRPPLAVVGGRGDRRDPLRDWPAGRAPSRSAGQASHCYSRTRGRQRRESALPATAIVDRARKSQARPATSGRTTKPSLLSSSRTATERVHARSKQNSRTEHENRKPVTAPSGRTSKPSLLSSLRSAMERVRAPATAIATEHDNRRLIIATRQTTDASLALVTETATTTLWSLPSGGRALTPVAHGASRSRCTTHPRSIARRRPRPPLAVVVGGRGGRRDPLRAWTAGASASRSAGQPT